MVLHTVQPGESPERIARAHGVPLSLLLAQNGLRPACRLSPGQCLAVPQGAQVCTVRRGDTLERIAARTGAAVRALLQSNPQLADGLSPGQVLALPPASRLGALAVHGRAAPHTDLRTLRRVLPCLTYLSIPCGGADRAGRLSVPDVRPLIRLARQYGAAPLLALRRGASLPADAAAADTFCRAAAAQGFAGVDLCGSPSDCAAVCARAADSGLTVLAPPEAGCAAGLVCLPAASPALPAAQLAQAVRRAVRTVPPQRLLPDLSDRGSCTDARALRDKLALAGEYRLRGVSMGDISPYIPQPWLLLSWLYAAEPAVPD